MNTRLGRFGSPHVSTNRNEHADEAGEAGEEGADRKTDGSLRPEGGEERHEHDDTDQGDNGVLTLHVGACPLLNGCGNLLHLLVPLG